MRAEGTGEAVMGRIAGPIRSRAAAAVVPICVEELGGVLFVVGPGTVLAAAVVAGVSPWVWFAVRPYRKLGQIEVETLPRNVFSREQRGQFSPG